MTSRRAVLALLALAATSASPVVSAAQDLSKPVVFVPPANHKPLGRIDSILRSPGGNRIQLIAMTPKDDGAMTATAQPQLHWYISGATELSATFSLRKHPNSSPTPILQCEVPGPIAAGVHEISLGKHGITLESNTDYGWYVRLNEPAGGKQPSVITSYIVVPDLGRVGGPRDTRATPEARYRAYMQQGYWYDALATIVGLFESVPLSTDYRNRYVELLKDGGLDDVAARVTTPPRVISACVAAPPR
jgi:hypothetical protein